MKLINLVISHATKVITNPLLLVLFQHINKLLFVVKVGLLDISSDRQFGELTLWSLLSIGRLFGAMEHQDPLNELTGGWFSWIAVIKEDLDLPDAARAL